MAPPSDSTQTLTYEFTYASDPSDIIDLTIVASATLSPVIGGDGAEGYATQSISGSIDGDDSVAQHGAGGTFATDEDAGFDNTIFISPDGGVVYGGNSGSSYGIDNPGLAFTASGVEYNLYTLNGEFLVFPADEPGDISELTLVATDVPCFCANTLILTECGEVAVQDVRPGMLVQTVDQGLQKVRWVGRSEVSGRLTDPARVLPIRIRAGALGENVPSRDLLVSPDHAIYLDGVLIAARQLQNGISIMQDTTMRAVTYFHIELDQHAIVLAENTPAESYLDSANREWFANTGKIVALHPMPSTIDRRMGGCAPLATDEATVEPIWRRLAERAGTDAQQATPATTSQSELRVVANDRTIRPISIDGSRACFVLPRGTDRIVLTSRAARPTELQPWLDDRRLLGVAVSRIRLRSGSDWHDMPVDHPAFGAGWWDIEQSVGGMWRWTNGAAQLALGPRASVTILEVHFAHAMRYPVRSAEPAPGDVAPLQEAVGFN